MIRQKINQILDELPKEELESVIPLSCGFKRIMNTNKTY